MTDIQLPEMPCRELVELVTEYLEDALPAQDRARFEAHLADCEDCNTYLDQMRQTISSRRDPRRGLPRLAQGGVTAAQLAALTHQDLQREEDDGARCGSTRLRFP